MSTTSDPNELMPLTELANRVLQERTRKINEFATSSKWAASAIVLQLSEGMGFEATVGLELRTPLEEPFQDIIVGWGGNREDAARAAAAEWLELALPGALAVHSDKDTHARLGETQKGSAVYSWRLAQGVLWVKGPDADMVKRELAASSIFDRLNMAAVLPMDRDVPWHCIKIRISRDALGKVSQICRLNNEDWPAGLALLQRFNPPGTGELEVKQYLFVRRTGKRPLSAAPSAARPSAPAPAKKPWWKVW